MPLASRAGYHAVGVAPGGDVDGGDEDDVDDEEGDQGGVAEVLSVNVGVRVAQLQGGRGEKQVVAVVAVSEAPGVKYI